MSERAAKEGCNGTGVSVSGTNEGVSDGNIVGKMGIQKKMEQAGASADRAETGDAHGNTDGTENVIYDMAVYEGISSDQGGKNTDLVRSESCERGDLSKGASWASIVSASSDEDEYAGGSCSADIADVNRTTPAVASDGDIIAGRSKGRSVVGQAWNGTVARSGDCAKGPTWVQCPKNGKVPLVGSEVSSDIKKPATDVKKMEKTVVIVDAGAVNSKLPVSDPTELDVCRSEIFDTAAHGSGVAGINTVAISDDAGIIYDADKGINDNHESIPDFLGSAMLRSVPASSKKCARTEKAAINIGSGKLNPSKVNPATAGKAKTDAIAGSGVRKAGPSFQWVKIRGVDNGFQPSASRLGCRNELFPPTVSSVIAGTAVKQMGEAGGPIAVSSQSTSDPRCSIPQTQAPGNKLSILGLGDQDFPPIRPLSDIGISREASKFGDGSVKTNSKFEDIGSVPTRSQPIRLGARNDKWVVGKSKGDTTSVLPSDDAKGSKNWRSLFVNRPKSCSSLAFYNPSTVDGKLTINPPPEAVAEGVGMWEGSLVGQFLDKRLPLHVIRSFIERLWGKREIPEISITDNGLYIFRFRDPVARDWVLENGPWYMAGRPIIIRLWKPGMEMLNVHTGPLLALATFFFFFFFFG